MRSCVPVITQLLGSKNSTDIIESLQFLTAAFEFGLKGGPEAVRKALALVWSSESQICEALVMMYKKLFLRFVHVCKCIICSYNIIII